MSDLADRADGLIHAEIAAGRNRLKSVPMPGYTGRCWFCDEKVENLNRFYNVDCRDDFEQRISRLRRDETK